jgi:hypothetical protein
VIKDSMAMDEPFECYFVGSLPKIEKRALACGRNWRANGQLCNFGH